MIPTLKDLIISRGLTLSIKTVRIKLYKNKDVW